MATLSSGASGAISEVKVIGSLAVGKRSGRDGSLVFGAVGLAFIGRSGVLDV